MGSIRKIFGRAIATASNPTNGQILRADSTQASGVKWDNENGFDLPTAASAGQVLKATGTGVGEYTWGSDNDTIFSLPAPGATGQVLKATGTGVGDYTWGVDNDTIFSLPAPASVGQVLKSTGTNVGDYVWGPDEGIPSITTYGATSSVVADSYYLTQKTVRIHIVSPGGGGGGGSGTAYAYGATPGGYPGNTGTLVRMVCHNASSSPLGVDITIGLAGYGGSTAPTDGSDGGDVTLILGTTAIVVPGGKGGWKGGHGPSAGSMPSPYPDPKAVVMPTFNGSTMYAGEAYVDGNLSFFVEEVSFLVANIPESPSGPGEPGFSPVGLRTMAGGGPGVGPVDAPNSALGASGGGGCSEYGGLSASVSRGGNAGPGIVILSI